MNKADEPCRAAPLTSSEPPRCWFHSRDNAEALSRGGTLSSQARRGRAFLALQARLYSRAEDLNLEFKPVPEDDVVPPHSLLFIESVNGREKAVGCFDAGEPYTPEFVERSPLDGWVKADSDHPYALRQRALSLVGLRENTCHGGNRRYRYTDRDERPVDEAKVEKFLKVLVPEEPTR